MQHAIQDLPVFAWGLGVIIGFPLLVVMLGEMIERLRRRDSQLARPLHLVRGILLPAAAIWVLLREILGHRGELVARLGDSLLLVALVPAALAALDLMLLSRSTPGTTWSRFPKLLFQLARLAVLFGATAFLLSGVWGIDLRGVLTALGVGSLVMALALQDTLSNLVSGVLLVFDRPFEIGDWVRSGDIVGKVVDINWRAVRLWTKDGDQVVIPNGRLGTNVIYNYTRPVAVHAERIEVCFAHEDAPNRVRRALLDLARATPGVLAQPAPEVRVLGYGDRGVSYQIKLWIDSYETADRVRDELITRIHYAAQRSGLTLAQSQQVVYQIDGVAAERAEREQRSAAHLQSLASLLRLDRGALAELEREASCRVYAARETVVRAGAPDGAMYVVLGGSVAVLAADQAGNMVEVEQLGRGDLFGNMATRWGEGSAVTVQAIDDVELLVLDAQAVLAMAEKDPSFALEMEQILDAQRRLVQRVSAAGAGV